MKKSDEILKQALEEQMQEEYQTFLAKREELDLTTSAAHDKKMQALQKRQAQKNAAKKSLLFSFFGVARRHVVSIAAICILLVGVVIWQLPGMRRVSYTPLGNNEFHQNGASTDMVEKNESKESWNEVADADENGVHKEPSTSKPEECPLPPAADITEAVTMSMDSTINSGMTLDQISQYFGTTIKPALVESIRQKGEEGTYLVAVSVKDEKDLQTYKAWAEQYEAAGDRRYDEKLQVFYGKYDLTELLYFAGENLECYLIGEAMDGYVLTDEGLKREEREE